MHTSEPELETTRKMRPTLFQQQCYDPIRKKKSGTVSTNIWFIIQILLMSKLKCCLLLAFLHKVSYTFTVDLTLDFSRISQYYTELRDMLVCYQCQMEKDCIGHGFPSMVIYFKDKKYTCIEPYIARTFFI